MASIRPALPGFQTERLVVRPFTRRDADALHTLLDLDPDDPGMTRDERRQAVEYRVTQLEWDEGIGSYGIQERATGQLVGYVGLQFHLLETQPHARPEIELFYGLGRSYRGMGYATEACRAMLVHAFGTLHLERLVSVTERANERSVRLLERLGAEVRDHPRRPDLVIGLIAAPTVRAPA
jgi:RimJ/RimL family protein N-acetyltransferase